MVEDDNGGSGKFDPELEKILEGLTPEERQTVIDNTDPSPEAGERQLKRTVRRLGESLQVPGKQNQKTSPEEPQTPPKQTEEIDERHTKIFGPLSDKPPGPKTGNWPPDKGVGAGPLSEETPPPSPKPKKPNGDKPNGK